MSYYSSDIHGRINALIEEMKQEQSEEKFEQLIELLKEKYGPEKYRNALASYFFEPAVFVKVTDEYREKHADKYNDEGCELFLEALEKSNSDSESESEDEECNACASGSSDGEDRSDSDSESEKEEDQKPMTEKEFIEYMKSLGAEEEEDREEEYGEEEDEEEEDEEEEDEDEEDEEEEEGSKGNQSVPFDESPERKELQQEYESSIEDIVPIENVSFLMMMFFSLDRDEKREFSKEIVRNKENKYYLQPNPFYLNHSGGEYHNFIQNCIQKHMGDGSETEKLENTDNHSEQRNEAEEVEAKATEVTPARSPSPFEYVSDCVIR
jgi:hypothetical protein